MAQSKSQSVGMDHEIQALTKPLAFRLSHEKSAVTHEGNPEPSSSFNSKIQKYVDGCKQMDKYISHLQTSVEKLSKQLQTARALSAAKDGIDGVEERLLSLHRQIRLEKTVHRLLEASLAIEEARLNFLDLLKPEQVYDFGGDSESEIGSETMRQGSEDMYSDIREILNEMLIICRNETPTSDVDMSSDTTHVEQSPESIVMPTSKHLEIENWRNMA